MCAVHMGTAMSRALAADLWENGKSETCLSVRLQHIAKSSSIPCTYADSMCRKWPSQLLGTLSYL